MNHDFQSGLAVGIWIGAIIAVVMTLIYGPILP